MESALIANKGGGEGEECGREAKTAHLARWMSLLESLRLTIEVYGIFLFFLIILTLYLTSRLALLQLSPEMASRRQDSPLFIHASIVAMISRHAGTRRATSSLSRNIQHRPRHVSTTLPSHCNRRKPRCSSNRDPSPAIVRLQAGRSLRTLRSRLQEEHFCRNLHHYRPNLRLPP